MGVVCPHRDLQGLHRLLTQTSQVQFDAASEKLKWEGVARAYGMSSSVVLVEECLGFVRAAAADLWSLVKPGWATCLLTLVGSLACTIHLSLQIAVIRVATGLYNLCWHEKCIAFYLVPATSSASTPASTFSLLCACRTARLAPVSELWCCCANHFLDMGRAVQPSQPLQTHSFTLSAGAIDM